MEEAAAANAANSNYDTSWSSKTNWTVADGFLVDSITFESLTINDDDDDHQNTDSNPTLKSPLILQPPSPDPPPCEITITFAQKYEVRQVYVRSTARIYEIYYASDLGSSNEYLCTVRCGVATREEEVLCTPSFEEAVAHLKGANKETDEKKSKSDGSLNTNEDGWVEVKALDSPQLDNGNSSLPSSGNAKQGESLQDFYEATAEINDAEPCVSITLRMLSLQNKGCIFVDEIYVFGDPIEPSDSDNRVGQMENSASSSLMAMFMPTLVQLSKSRTAGQVLGNHTFNSKEKQKSQEIGSKATDSISAAKNIQKGGDSGSGDKQEEKVHETVKATSIPAHMEMPAQVSDTVCKHDSPSSHIDKVLDQLVSRVSRIEDFFLRFEERMLKPINSIDARLQRVEQQLEELTKKPQYSELRCTRISAPEFSWHESDDNFFDNNENSVVESDVKGYTVPIPADDVADSSNNSQSHSSLLLTDPVSSNAEDEEENNALEAATGSANDKPKLAMSVDEALALALTGFLSSVSASPRKYIQALAIKAPDFSVEEDNTTGKRSSHEVEGRRATDPPIRSNAADIAECTNESLSTSSNISCSESEVKATKSVDDHYSEKAGEEGKDDSLDRGIHSMVAPSRPKVATDDKKNIEVSDRVNHISVDECETGNQFLESQTDDGLGLTEEVAVLNSESSINEEVVKDQSDKDVLWDLRFSCASSVVDFEIPILDVKFVSQETSNVKSPFEALLDGVPETNVEAQYAKEDDDSFQIFQQDNLISVDDTELTSPANGNHPSMDMNYCSLDDMPLYAEGEKLHDYFISNKKEAYASSLI